MKITTKELKVLRKALKKDLSRGITGRTLDEGGTDLLEILVNQELKRRKRQKKYKFKCVDLDCSQILNPTCDDVREPVISLSSDDEEKEKRGRQFELLGAIAKVRRLVIDL